MTAPSSVDHSLLEGVCADVVSDLAGIGARLGLPVLAPTSSRLTDPLAIVFAPHDVDGTTLAVTGYFNGVKHHLTPGSPDEGFVKEPCQITLYPLLYGGEHASLGGVSDRLHVLLSHEVVHCYQDVVFSEKAISQTVPAFIGEGSATYLATSYAGYGEPGTASFWSKGWLGIPGRDLTARRYDAVGWYSLVAHVTGNNLWSKMVEAWRAFESGGASAFISTLGGDSVAVGEGLGGVAGQPADLGGRLDDTGDRGADGRPAGGGRRCPGGDRRFQRWHAPTMGGGDRQGVLGARRLGRDQRGRRVRIGPRRIGPQRPRFQR